MNPDFQPGQWLIMNDDPDCKAFIVGKNAEGKWVIEWKDGETSVDGGCWSDWHHEPECTGWDWQPETWPKYYSSIEPKYYPFVRRISATHYMPVKHDGTDGLRTPNEWTDSDDRKRAEITESEALSRIVKPVEVVADKPEIDPGKGYRLIDKEVDVPQKGDEIWNPWLHKWDPRAEYDGKEYFAVDTYRRRIPACAMCGGPADITEDNCKACHEFAIQSVCGIEKPNTPLALDVSLEKARALHRVWRALNDGDCPKCHTFHRASEIRESYPPVRRDEFDGSFAAESISCPTCGFTIQRVEIEEIERMFAPAMDAAVAIFEEWQTEQRQIKPDEPPQPAEDPDEWVTLPDEHVLRQDIDWVKYRQSTEFELVSGLTGNTVEFARKSEYPEARCRRRDLPPLPEKPATRTVTLYEWIRWDDANPNDISILWETVATDLWDHSVMTGNTRTIEVPI